MSGSKAQQLPHQPKPPMTSITYHIKDKLTSLEFIFLAQKIFGGGFVQQAARPDGPHLSAILYLSAQVSVGDAETADF